MCNISKFRKEDFTVEQGDRIAQAVVAKVTAEKTLTSKLRPK